MLKTDWTGPSEGATLNELHDAIGALVRCRPTNDAEHNALFRLVGLSEVAPAAWNYRTNLAIRRAGNLTEYDLIRIAHCA